MQAFRRSAAKAAQTARVSLPRQSRRCAHDAHHGAHDVAYPADEPLGKAFYLLAGGVPLAAIIYKVAGANAGDDKLWFTRFVNSYNYYKDIWADRNRLHVEALEAAAHDRHLFFNSTARRHVDLNFPEAFNTGSPYNVPAGSQADLSKVIAHYEKQNFEEQARKLEALANGTLKAEQSASGIGKNPPNP
ncbi:uncharacterized protein K452DRAFT_262664 [Aplosporella prunicola CBS 121167]|uniref:NADH-ubiquinone oxidoreductase 17.8 kDa subunit n=1 Tax=Aplosporella prunicola CBS 121167 TaxID=1176127 RepID=A0A6A6BTF3_9PEZI|nr:uncharacterized protein K452DRAFT_262664 [Aplosporella prunicola CBS 121167]KAF2146663.1 hypothetical protein K452DRAFT_262664 [Aplosporella prunicola CBS 121167]